MRDRYFFPVMIGSAVLSCMPWDLVSNAGSVVFGGTMAYLVGGIVWIRFHDWLVKR